MFDIEPIALHPDATAMETKALRDPKEHEVSGIFDKDDIAWIAKTFGYQIQQLLRTMRDQKLLGRIGSLVQLGQAFRCEPPQFRVTGGCAVLQCRAAGACRC